MFVGAHAARVQTTDLILTLQSLRASFPASGTPRSGVFFKPLHCGEGSKSRLRSLSVGEPVEPKTCLKAKTT